MNGATTGFREKHILETTGNLVVVKPGCWLTLFQIQRSVCFFHGGFPPSNLVLLGKVSQESTTLKILTNTLHETNIAPTNGWLEYYFPIGEAYFQGLG